MRVAYGYCRREADFADLAVDRIWLDGKGTDRLQRTDMLRLGLRRGDILVLLSRGDLAPGKQINTIEKIVAEKGATIEVREGSAAKRQTGPKRAWQLSDPRKFRTMWGDQTLDGPYVLRLACEDVGLEPTDENKALMRSRLVRLFGTRGNLKSFKEPRI